MTMFVNAEFLEAGFDYINARTYGQVLTFNKAVFFYENESQVISEMEDATVGHVTIGSNTVSLKADVNQLVTSDRLFNYVTYYVNDTPFIKCKLLTENMIVRKQSNSPGFRLSHQLRLELPDLFSIFTFPSETANYAEVKSIPKSDLTFPWFEKHSMIVIYDWLFDKPVPTMNVGNDYWGCPYMVNFENPSYYSDITTLSGGISGDNYKE